MAFRRFVRALLAAFAISVASLSGGAPAFAESKSVAAAQGGALAQFSTEAAAQSHCPADTVVWLNTRTGIWHEKGMRWYGNTKQGAYVCRTEAAAAGDRDTHNGQ